MFGDEFIAGIIRKTIKNQNDIDCLYPVTCLTTLSLAEKDKLLILDVILARELVNNAKVELV
jgi:hypothetical protein